MRTVPYRTDEMNGYPTYIYTYNFFCVFVEMEMGWVVW